MAHSSFGAPLVAKVSDSHGDPVSGTPVTFSAPTSGASGTFASCAGGNNSASTTCVVDTNASGIATSSTFTANTVAGGPYNVSASVSGVSTPANFSLTNTIAGASKLVFITQPTSGQNITAGNGTTFKVAVEDPYGNIETSDNATKVTLGFSSNPGGSTLNCTNGGGSGPVTVSAGEASFTCSLNKAATGYTLSATSAPTRTPATSNSFNIVAGQAMTLVFSTEPPTSTVASATFSTTVSIKDLYGNVVTTDSNTVTLSLLANPCSGTLTGTTSKAAVHGVVTFSGLQITKACSGYTLWAYDMGDGALNVTSNPFAITAAGASKLVFTAEPPASTPSTSTFGVTVTIEDTYGNTVSTDTHTVALSLSTNPCGGTLGGTKSEAALGGVATFSGLQITTACTGYKLSAADSSDFLSTTSTAFAITAASGENFTINGSTTSPLYPGTSQPINLSITNPNPESITVTAGSITLSVTPSAGCSSANFVLSQNLTAVNAVVPADSTKSLSDLSIPQADWPFIEMLNTSTSQDNCKGAALTFTWGATGSGS